MGNAFSNIDFYCQQIVDMHYNETGISFEDILNKLRIPEKDIAPIKTKLSGYDDLRITRDKCYFKPHAKISAADKVYFSKDPTKNYYKYFERSGVGTDYEFKRVEEFDSGNTPRNTFEFKYELIGVSAPKPKRDYKPKNWFVEKITENLIRAVVSGLVTFGLGFTIGWFAGKSSNQSRPEKHQKEQPPAMQETTKDSTKILK
jgi:hypothetical protein